MSKTSYNLLIILSGNKFHKPDLTPSFHKSNLWFRYHDSLIFRIKLITHHLKNNKQLPIDN